MLLRFSAALSAAATALNVLLTDKSMSATHMAGFAALRFVEYFMGIIVSYAATALVVTELTVKLDEPQPEEPSKFWQWNFRQLAEIVCFFMRVNIKVTGREKLPTDRRYLLVCNHKSLFDPVSKAKVFGDENYVYISKPSNFKIPIAGKVMYKCGCMALNRENNREALGTIKRASELIKNDKASIVIYPEGTRGKTDELLPFHAGSFKIAQRAGSPIVVAAAIGTDKVVHNFPFKSSTVKIDIVEVLDEEFVKSHSTKETAELVQSIIQERLDREISKENCSNNA